MHNDPLASTNEANSQAVVDAVPKHSRYLFETRIGEGAMGTVWRAHDPELNRNVAIKVIRGDRINELHLLERFRTEARILAAIKHPNVVTVYDACLDDSFPLIVMEVVDGENVAQLIIRAGNVELRRAIAIIKQAASGLAAAHSKGLVHRDVKPSNLLLDSYGEVKIVDFGLSRTIHVAEQHSICGTPAYMSPEQANGRNVDGRTDVYALGALFYQLLTGALPFPEISNGGLNAVLDAHTHKPIPKASETRSDLNLPLDVDRIIEKAMAKDVKNRYQTAQEMIQALNELERSLEPQKKGKSPFILASCIVSALLLIVAVLLIRNPAPKKDPLDLWVAEVSALSSAEERLTMVIAEIKRINPLLAAEDLEIRQETHHGETGCALYFKRRANISNWRPIQALRNDLVCLIAQDCKLEDTSVLADCKRLKVLDLSYTGGLKSLVPLSVSKLYLRETGISSLEFLRGNKSLEILEVISCPLEVKNFDALGETGIKTLSVTLEGEDVLDLQKLLPNVDLTIF